MSRVKLDTTDRRILKILQEEGRITNVELAGRVGISAPPCLRRVRGLEEAGYIKGYHAVLDNESLGFGVTVFAMVGLDSQAESDLVAFEEMAASWPLVRECFMLAGEIDYMLKVVAHDWDEYQHFVTDQLTAAPNVAQVKTSLTIRNALDLPGVPIDEKPLAKGKVADAADEGALAK